MYNIVKLYNNKDYDEIQKYILSKPELFNNKKYIYVRANTEYKLGLYEDSYISFHTLLNYCQLDNHQRILNKNCSFECLEKITENKKVKINYDNEYIDLPNNFGWIIPGILCAMSCPFKKSHIRALEFYNIKYIVSLVQPIVQLTELNEESSDSKENEYVSFNKKILKGIKINRIVFEVPDSGSPTVEQTDKILSLIETCKLTKEGILINCTDGLGRTGTILACYFLKGNKNYPQMSSRDAIERVRTIRPNSVETREQENFVLEYSNILWKRYSDDNINNFKNYPSTYHLPFSQGIGLDDNVGNITKFCFLNNEIVITEKMNGINCCLKEGQVYVRNQYNEPTHENFSLAKKISASLKDKLPESLWLFGENVVTNEKKKLRFYVFGVYDSYSKIWLSWEETKIITAEFGLELVPEIYVGHLSSYRKLKSWTKACYMSNEESGDMSNEELPVVDMKGKEGYVIRITDRFENKDFNNCLAKFCN